MALLGDTDFFLPPLPSKTHPHPCEHSETHRWERNTVEWSASEEAAFVNRVVSWAVGSARTGHA